jgi:Xaa-Pro aminopeptidase
MDAAEFRSHRQRTLDVFHSSGITNGLIVYSSPPQPREPFTGSELPFIQEGLFFWLSGWSNPDSSIVIDIATGFSIFFLPDYPENYVIWHGTIPTSETVIARTGVDKVLKVSQIVEVIQEFNPSVVFTTTEPISFEWAKIDRHTLLGATAVARTVKSEREIACLRKASEITGQAIVGVWKTLRWRPGLTERNVEGYFQFQANLLGCHETSFLTIVGAGADACFLHCDQCPGEVKQNDLILLDCGVFYEHYAGDITRTFPASGKFSPIQEVVYSNLLTLEKELIEAVAPGVEWVTLERKLLRGVFDILVKLGVVSPDVRCDHNITAFFIPHGLSHHIGCNVHDPCDYTEDEAMIKAGSSIGQVLVPGHVISIEPGIYFHPLRIARLARARAPLNRINREVAAQLAEQVGGIRIEDDVLVTKDGREVLSRSCPKEIADIEALFAAPV